jgi:hypothetical protein
MGLLLWSGRQNMSAAGDFLALGIADGYLHFRFNLGSGEVIIPYNFTRVDDGLWHRVKAVRCVANLLFNLLHLQRPMKKFSAICRINNHTS